jgi:hypothetical protein
VLPTTPRRLLTASPFTPQIVLLVFGAQLFVSYPHRLSVCMSNKAAFKNFRPFIHNISGTQVPKRLTYLPTYVPSKRSPAAAEFLGRDWQGFYTSHSSGWLHVLAVRDPLERLLSGYMNKCACTREFRPRLPLWCVRPRPPHDRPT